MERPRRPDRSVEDLVSQRGDLIKHAAGNIYDHRDHAPERHEIRRKRDHPVRLVRGDVAALRPPLNLKDLPAEAFHESRMRELVAEHVAIQEKRLRDLRPEPTQHHQRPDREIPERLGLPEALFDGRVRETKEENPGRHPGERQQQARQHSSHDMGEKAGATLFLMVFIHRDRCPDRLAPAVQAAVCPIMAATLHRGNETVPGVRSFPILRGFPGTFFPLLLHGQAEAGYFGNLNESSTGFLRQHFEEQAQILSPADLQPAESAEVIRHPLRVEQPEAKFPQPPHQGHQRDLGGVGLTGKHALAEKRFS